MRILLLTQWKPSRGGVVKHVENLIANSKHTFEIITYIPNINVRIIRPFFFLVFGVLRGIFKNFDIIHAHYTIPQGLLGVILKKIKRKPLILTLHGSDITELANSSLFRPLVRWIISNSDGIIAVSKYLKMQALELGVEETKFRVIYGGVSASRSKYMGIKNKGVVFVGSLVKQKGVDILIKSFEIVGKKHSDSKLIIIGDGSERKVLEKLARELRIDVVFHGYLDDFRDILNKSLVFVLPSRTEGFGLVLLEAMEARIPIIATDVGGIKEIVVNDENGLLVKKEDVNSLADAINKIIEDNDLKNRLIFGGRKTIKKFSWSRMADEVDVFYKEIAKRDY
jgi:N-acetyl-alpha-D-glucosaminyl L-malate synthase BshA|tara:strand:- start:117 stop:1133 length:1017 start_codon:yes stop_codon:yes gene_type:complete